MIILFFSDGKVLYKIEDDLSVELVQQSDHFEVEAAFFYQEKIQTPFIMSLTIPAPAIEQKVIGLLRKNIRYPVNWLLFEPAMFDKTRGYILSDDAVWNDLPFILSSRLRIKNILIADNGLDKDYGANIKYFDPYIFYELENISKLEKETVEKIDYNNVFSCFGKKFKSQRYYIVNYLKQNHKEISFTTLGAKANVPMLNEICGKTGFIMPTTVPNINPYYKKYMINVVMETNYFTPYQNYSEKTLDAIKFRKPFILVAPPYTLNLLKSQGFKTFDRYWNEDYDLEIDHVKRLEAITKTIDNIANMSYNTLKEIHLDMQNVLEHNLKHLETLRNDLNTKLREYTK